MDSFLYISAAVASICLAVLFVYLIKLILSAKNLIDNSAVVLLDLSNEVKSVKVEAKELLDNVDVILKNLVPTLDTLNESLVKINNQIDSVETIVGHAKNVSSNLDKASEGISYAVSKAGSVAGLALGARKYFKHRQYNKKIEAYNNAQEEIRNSEEMGSEMKTSKEKKVKRSFGNRAESLLDSASIFSALLKAYDSFKNKYTEIESEQNGDLRRIYETEGYDDTYMQ